jgi:outer membrane receptor protein involved in Fe transport
MRCVYDRSVPALALGALPLAAALILTGTPALSRAADEPPAAAAETTGNTSTGGLVEITVTATRREENLSKVPISVTARPWVRETTPRTRLPPR